MKTSRIVIILSVLLLSRQLIFAQLPCGKPDVSYQEELISQKLIQQYSAYSKQSRVAYATTYIAVKPHFVRTDASITTLNMGAFNNALAICNQYFINAGIQFYICGTPTNTPNFINNSAMYDWNTANFNRDAITAANNVNNAHNIYFSGSVGGAGGFSFGMTQNKVNNRTFILNGQADDNKTLAHELGHYFNLAHTFNNADASTIPNRELVTRNASEIAPRLSANCTTSGDFVCDTPADPYNLAGSNLSSCNNTGIGITALDANGDAFVPSAANVMNYYFCSPYIFSTGQYARMNAALAVNNTPSSNASERYTLDCAEANLNAPTSVSLSNLVSGVSLGVVIAWSDNSTNETGYIIERSTTSATTGFVPIGGVDANILTFTDKNVNRNTTYYYRVKASNTKTRYNTTVPNITTPSICGALHTSACVANGNIDVFKILNGTTVLLDKSASACSVNSYGDFTGMTSPTVLAGKTYNFTMKTGYTSGNGYVPQHLGIWIDANQDNDFEDLGEMVYQSTGSGIMSGTTQLNSTFTIPATAKVGNLRMRVRSRSQYEGIVVSPCDAQDSGETEDYLIAVGRSITVNGNLPSICPSSATGSLSFTPNYVPNSGNNYSIELSDNTGTFGTTPLVIGTGSGSPISVTIPSSVTAGSAYRFRVKGSNPAVVGNESGNFGYGVSSATLSLIGNNTIAIGDSAKLRLTFTGAKPYSFTLSNGKTVSNITTDIYECYVKPSISSTYTITSATGGCGNATISGTVYVGVSAYCLPSYSTACTPNNSTSPQLAINRFELIKNSTTLLLDNNNSNCSATNFSDYTNLTAPLVKRDSSYSVIVTGHISSGGSYYPMYYAVWIDYNHNNNFNDSGELVWASTVADNFGAGTFTIPASALSGNTRIRIRSHYSSSPTDACATYSYGEAEDYMINIETPPIVSVGGSVAGSTRVCPNKNTNTLTLSGHTGNVLRWQSADNNTFSPFTDITNTTTTLTVTNIPTTKYYRAVLQAGTSAIAYSAPAVLTVSSPPTVAQTTVNMNFGNTVSLVANGCSGVLSWCKSTGGIATMPVSPRCTDRYFAKCEETNGTEKCFTNSPTVTVKVIPLGAELTSIISGNWESSSTWNIGRSPQNGDLVIIRPNDTVTITTATAQAQCLEMSGFNSIQYTNPNGKLSLGF
jgi:hypothetical protein